MPRASTYHHVRRLSLATLLLAAAAGFASAPACAQSFAPTVNISNTSADAWNGTHQMAVVSPYVYVTWFDGRGPLFSRSTNSGQTFSAPIEIFKGAQGGQAWPLIAATGSNVYVARSVPAKSNQPMQVFFRRSIDNGATFGNQVQVSSASIGNGASLRAMATAGASVYLVWSQPAPTNPDVFFARSVNGGATFGTPVNLSNSSAWIDSVTLAAEGAGVHVAWSEDVGGASREIFYRQSTDGGSTFGGVSNVSNSAASSAFPHIAVSGPNVYLAWTEAEIRFSASNDGSTSFSAPVDLSSGMSDTSCQGGGPRLAASGNALQVIWHSDHLGNCEVFHRASLDGGATFPNTESNISMSAQHSLGGVVTANGANVLIAWSDALPSGEIYLVHSGDNGATFGAQVNVSISSGESRNPRLAIASPTQINAIWLDRTPGNWDVFSARGTLP